MTDAAKHLDSALAVLKANNIIHSQVPVDEIAICDHTASAISVGDYTYFIMDLFEYEVQCLFR